MYVFEILDRFQFHDDLIFDQKIQAMLAYHNFFVSNRNCLLTFYYRTLFERLTLM